MRRAQQGGGLGQGRLATGVQDQPVARDGADQFAPGALRGGGRLLPVRRGAVLLGRRVDQPGQPVGEALLGERVPLQTDQHPDGAFLAAFPALRLRALRTARRALRAGARLVQGVLEGECLALRERALHGRVGIRHAALGQRGGEPRQLQRGVPGQGRLLQEPHGDGTAATLVVRPALGAEQRAGEPVGLLRPHPGDLEQLPGVRAQRVPRALTEERRGLRRERFGGAALRQYAPHRLHGLRCRPRGPCGCGGPLGGRRPGRARRLRRGAAHGLGVAEDRGRRLLTALHGAHGGQQIGRRAAEPAPAAIGPCFSAFRRSIRSRSIRWAASSASTSDTRAAAPSASPESGPSPAGSPERVPGADSAACVVPGVSGPVSTASVVSSVAGSGSVLTACSSRDRDSGARAPTRRRAPGRSRQED
ncbi:hypothetical protein SVIOM342S_06563 [Streptomyces violaceorubidus]